MITARVMDSSLRRDRSERHFESEIEPAAQGCLAEELTKLAEAVPKTELVDGEGNENPETVCQTQGAGDGVAPSRESLGAESCGASFGRGPHPPASSTVCECTGAVPRWEATGNPLTCGE